MDLEQEDLLNVKEKCPAFKSGCPYSKSGSHDSELHSRTKTLCPAFQAGCPFSKASSEADLQHLLSSVPESHSKCPVNSSLLKTKMSICSNGETLVNSLMKRNWTIFFLDTEAETDFEVSDLAKKMRRGTIKSHKAAEDVPFIKRYILCDVDVPTYKRFLLILYHIYDTIECEIERNQKHPSVAAIYFPSELNRKPAIERDLDFFYGAREKWIKIPRSMETQRYVDRLKEVGATSPDLLVAHAFTRYMGDLFGGQKLKIKARKSMKLPEEGAGTEFYEFPNIEDIPSFRKLYFSRLDDLIINPNVVDSVVEEANLAFKLNMNVFIELDQTTTIESSKNEYTSGLLALIVLILCLLIVKKDSLFG